MASAQQQAEPAVITGMLRRGSAPQRVYWGAGLDPWQVLDTQGRITGWLLVDTPRRESGAMYYLSDAEPRPGKPTTPRTSPHLDPMQ